MAENRLGFTKALLLALGAASGVIVMDRIIHLVRKPTAGGAKS